MPPNRSLLIHLVCQGIAWDADLELLGNLDASNEHALNFVRNILTRKQV